jgi:hypothetical protein
MSDHLSRPDERALSAAPRFSLAIGLTGIAHREPHSARPRVVRPTQANGGILRDMRDEPIRLHLRTTLVDPVAVDVTLLLAASSYIQPADGRSDPRAADAFDAVTSAYCNGAELYVPLPKTDVEAVPFFFNLWSQASALNTVPDLELTDEAYAAGAATLNSHLAVFMEGDAWDVAHWTAFQFTQDIVESHLRRADMESIRRAGEAAATLIESDRLLLLRNAIGELQRNRRISVPEEYEPLVGTSDIPSFFHLVVAYAISVSIRGCSYAHGLAQLPAKPIYRHHWMRSPALRHAFVESTVLEATATEWIPWGSILRKIFDPKVAERPSRVDLERVLVALRSMTPRLREDLTQTREKPHANGITDDEELLIKALLDVGIAPRYAGTRGAEKLASWLRDLVGLYVPIFKVPVELITSSLQPHIFRQAETRLRLLTFRRDTFWEVLEDPGIKAALRRR